jgi:hypothetical protein
VKKFGVVNSNRVDLLGHVFGYCSGKLFGFSLASFQYCQSAAKMPRA